MIERNKVQKLRFQHPLLRRGFGRLKLLQQFTTIFLTLLYFTVTVGFGVHECRCKKERNIVFGVVFTDGNVCCCKKTEKTNKRNCCDNDLSPSSCCSPEQSCCASENNEEAPACCSKRDRFSTGKCCSLTFQSLDADYKHTELSLPNVPNDFLLAAALLPLMEISAGTDTDILTFVKYPPPDRYGKTLPVYHFCQLRL